MRRAVRYLCFLLLSVMPLAGLSAAEGVWFSPALGGDVSWRSTESPAPAFDENGYRMTVVCLEHLGVSAPGAWSLEEDVQWLLEQGYRVIEIDYGHSPLAVSPALNLDIMALNRSLRKRCFPEGVQNNVTGCSNTRTWILPEGYRLHRDLPYCQDDPSVYRYPDENYQTGDSLYFDLIAPSDASLEQPVVLSFSYSNSYHASPRSGQPMTHQRMYLGYTLAMFDDSFLEGAPLRGMAWAIADHPKYADWGNGNCHRAGDRLYGSFETNPDAVSKVKAAIRMLRGIGSGYGLSGAIGLYGFSRGSSCAALAVGDRKVQAFESAGAYLDESDDVQAAILGPGVFDYTIVYDSLGDSDINLEKRCPQVWGPLDDNRARWDSMGAVWMVESRASAPVMFFCGREDEDYYWRQMERFRAVLDEKGVETEFLENSVRRHSVPTDTVSLRRMYDFVLDHCQEPAVR